MKIKIFDRMCFFSHRPGVSVIIPNTLAIATVYPSRLILQGEIFDFSIVGPVDKFTVFQDLEKGKVEVSGFSKKGFFRYCIFAKDGKLQVHFTSLPIATEALSDKVRLTLSCGSVIEKPIEGISSPNQERLFLGVSKQKDFEMVERRLDLREILPYWFCLGQNIPALPDHYEGLALLFADCEKIMNRKESSLEELLKKIFITAFSSIFCPRLEDSDHHGIFDAAFSCAPSSIILSKGAKIIRSLFFKEEEETLFILPLLLKSLHCGRLINLSFTLGSLDLSWSKGVIKTMVVRASKSGSIRMGFDKTFHFFRLRTSLKEKGERLSKEALIALEEGKTYYFDRFEK